MNGNHLWVKIGNWWICLSSVCDDEVLVTMTWHFFIQLELSFDFRDLLWMGRLFSGCLVCQ